MELRVEALMTQKLRVEVVMKQNLKTGDVGVAD